MSDSTYKDAQEHEDADSAVAGGAAASSDAAESKGPASAHVSRESRASAEEVREGMADVAEWYDSLWRENDATETIGLLGGRGGSDGRYDTSRRSKLRRLNEMLGIVRKYDVLHGLTPKSMRQMLEELGPTFVKAGQILSMRSEILPESFCRELGKLRTNVEPMDRETVLAALRAEYDEPVEDLFDAIDDVPLGSASVAQVHKARLITGETVALKIQRPHVQETMAQDISIMRSLAKRAVRFMGDDQFLDLQSVVDELWQSFREETDFLVEARSLEEFRRNNAGVAFVTCPKPYPRLCTEHVVCMDYVEGIPIGDTKRLAQEGYDLAEIGEKLVDNYTQQILEDGFFHADPHPGNLVIRAGKIVYLDLGIMGRLSSHDRAAMRDMIFAVANHDTAMLENGLLRFSIGAANDVDHAALLADLDQIMDDFGTADLAELDLGRFLTSLVSMARKDGIELPGSVTQLSRALVTLEGVVDEFLPGVSMVQIIQRHIRTHLSSKDFLKDEFKSYAKETEAATHGLLKAASQASLAMNMLTRGQLRVGLDLTGSSTDPISEMAHAADRLTMGIVIAGLFIGSSVIYYARIQPVIFGIPVLGFVGFIMALVLGVGLLRQISQERKHHRGRS